MDDEFWELYANSRFECEGCGKSRKGKFTSQCTDGKRHSICNTCITNGTHTRLHNEGKWKK